MPFTVKGHFYVYCKEQLSVNTAGSDRFAPYIEHEVGNKSPIGFELHQVWSYQRLVVPYPAGLTLDFAALPQGIPGITKDLKTDQTLSLLVIDNLEDDTQLTIQLLTGGAPLPGVGYALGPSNVLIEYDDKGQSLLNQFIDGMKFDVIVGDQDAHIEIMLGTVSTLSPT